MATSWQSLMALFPYSTHHGQTVFRHLDFFPTSRHDYQNSSTYLHSTSQTFHFHLAPLSGFRSLGQRSTIMSAEGAFSQPIRETISHSLSSTTGRCRAGKRTKWLGRTNIQQHRRACNSPQAWRHSPRTNHVRDMTLHSRPRPVVYCNAIVRSTDGVFLTIDELGTVLDDMKSYIQPSNFARDRLAARIEGSISGNIITRSAKRRCLQNDKEEKVWCRTDRNPQSWNLVTVWMYGTDCKHMQSKFPATTSWTCSTPSVTWGQSVLCLPDR
jgi:hypothetical protein